MSALYYEARLSRLQTENFWMEIITALTASGSGVAAFMTEGPAQAAWKVLSLAAAIVAIVKPIYSPGKRIEDFTRQHQGYHQNYFNLRKLAFSIRQQGKPTPEHRRNFDTFFDRYVQLSNEDEITPNERLVSKAQADTNREFPPGSFWQPPRPGNPQPQQPPELPAPAGAQPPRPAGRNRRAAWLGPLLRALVLIVVGGVLAIGIECALLIMQRD